MKITENISSLIKKGNEELKNFEFLKFAKGLVVLSSFSLAMVYSLRGRAEEYYQDNNIDEQTKTTIMKNDGSNSTKEKINIEKINNKYISTSEIVKLMNLKGNEDLLEVAKSDFLSPDSYKKSSMHEKYDFLNNSKAYTKFTQSQLSELENSNGYEDTIKKDKNVFTKQEKNILEKEKSISFIKIENLKRLNEYIKNNYLNKNKNNLKSETFDYYLTKLEEQKEFLSSIEKTIFKIGHYNFGNQMRSLEFLNSSVENDSDYLFNIKSEILEFEFVLKNHPILKEKTDELITKMNNIINKNSLNGKILTVNDKEYLKNSINLLKNMKNDMKNIENEQKLKDYSSKLTKLESMIGIKNINEIQYSKSLETNGIVSSF